MEKEDFKEIIDSLLSSADILEPKEEELLKASQTFIHGDDLDMFFCLDYAMDKIKNHISAKCGKNDTERFVLIHCDMIENLLADTITKNEGSICCHDKARTVISQYLRKSRGEKYAIDNTKSFHPSVGETDEWLNLCQGICLLIMGKQDEYLKALAVILKRYELIKKD